MSVLLGPPTVDCHEEDPEWAALHGLKYLRNKGNSHAALSKLLSNVERKDRGDLRARPLETLDICVPGAFEGETCVDHSVLRSEPSFSTQLPPSVRFSCQNLR